MYLGRTITVDLAGELKGRVPPGGPDRAARPEAPGFHAVRVDNARRRLQKLVRFCAAGTRQWLEFASATKPCAVRSRPHEHEHRHAQEPGKNAAEEELDDGDAGHSAGDYERDRRREDRPG